MAAPPKQAPADKRIVALGLKQEASDRYSARNSMMKEMRERRHQDHAVSIPDNYRATTTEVRLSLLGDVADLMTAIVGDSPWRVHMDPYDEGSTAKKSSSLREKWSEAAVLQAQDPTNRQVLANVASNQIGDGVGVLKVIYRPDHWTALPTARSMFGKSAMEMDSEEAQQYNKSVEKAKRGAALPFSIVDVDPITWHPFYGADGELAAVIEIREHRLNEALLLYKDRVRLVDGNIVPIGALGESYTVPAYDSSVSNPGTRVHVWEYWDREETITFIENVAVSYHKHGMGMVPYFECYSRPSADRDPAINSRPMIYKQKWLSDLIDSFWTMMTNAGYLYCYPTPTVKTPLGVEVPTDDTGRPEVIEWEPGKLMRTYQGQEFAFITPPIESFKMMGDLLQQALSMFESSTGLGNAIRGIGGADQPGYAINQLIQASMLSLNPAIESRDRMLANMIKFLWRLVEKRVKQDVWVYGTNPDPDVKSKTWLKLGPSDIDGYYRCEVESKALLDQKRIAMGQFGAAMVKSRLLDRRRVIEDFLGYEDPDGILDDIDVDEMISTGPLHDKLMEQLLRRRGIIPPPQPPAPQGPPEGQNGAGAPPMPGMPTNLPPAGPGLGMPMQPPEPQAPQGMGMNLPPGRAAGADREGPQQMPVDMHP